MLKPRHQTRQVKVGNILIGGGALVVVQSMTDTDTADRDATVKQIIDLANHGSEIVRITVNNEDAAKQVPYIKEQLLKMNCHVPLVGDFHYNGHNLLSKYPDCALALDKYRINPGNVGFGDKHDPQFKIIIEQAIKHDKAVRIGVNWGSLDQDIATKLMDENSKKHDPLPSEQILQEAMIVSALTSAKRAEELGLRPNKIVISCKVSRVNDLVDVYRKLASQCDYALHLGLTEAGMGSKGIVASTAALAILLSEGIGDTIRVSLTPQPGAARNKEVITCQEILQSIGLRSFTPSISSCPGCGRTTSSFFRELASEITDFVRNQMHDWQKKYIGVENMNIAVMGCIVNGPGESKHANIGISLPGTGESPAAPVFIDGKKAMTLRGDNIISEFKDIIVNYVTEHYSERK